MEPGICPHCYSTNLVAITEGVPPPHHGKLECGNCGRWLKWLAGPLDRFCMPFGKYKGSTLSEIDRSDREYLQWIAAKADFSNAKVQAKVRQFLGTSAIGGSKP